YRDDAKLARPPDKPRAISRTGACVDAPASRARPRFASDPGRIVRLGLRCTECPGSRPRFRHATTHDLASMVVHRIVICRGDRGVGVFHHWLVAPRERDQLAAPRPPL